jgi:hypothetical protein
VYFRRAVPENGRMQPGTDSLVARALCFVAPLLLVAASVLATAASRAAAPVVELAVTGVIGPATAEYVARGLAHGVSTQAPLVVLRLDTPGGLDTSMRSIVQDILASTIPVVAFVAPPGARAAATGRDRPRLARRRERRDARGRDRDRLGEHQRRDMARTRRHAA